MESADQLYETSDKIDLHVCVSCNILIVIRFFLKFFEMFFVDELISWSLLSYIGHMNQVAISLRIPLFTHAF